MDAKFGERNSLRSGGAAAHAGFLGAITGFFDITNLEAEVVETVSLLAHTLVQER